MAVYKRYNGKKITSKDKNWSKGRWYIYKRVKGHKIIHKSVPEAITKEDAEKAERKEIEKLFNRRYGVLDTITTFADFVDKTYKRYVEQNNVNKKAKDFYCAELKKHFGKMTLTLITPQDCRDYQFKRKNSKTRLGKLYAPSSVNREMSTLSKIFSLACQEGLLDRNPAQFVKSLKEPPPRKRLLSNEQKDALLLEISKDEFLYNALMLAINLPLRRGQILAIKKEDIDFEHRTLSIIASKGRAQRILPINTRATEILKALAERVKSGHLFLYKGKPVKNFGKRWRNALRRAEINKEGGSREDNYHFHDVRTWFSERLLKRNVHSKVIQGLFGHSSESITDIYTNTNPFFVEAVNSLDSEVQEVKNEQ